MDKKDFLIDKILIFFLFVLAVLFFGLVFAGIWLTLGS